jgi:hypothetical protein
MVVLGATLCVHLVLNTKCQGRVSELGQYESCTCFENTTKSATRLGPNSAHVGGCGVWCVVIVELIVVMSFALARVFPSFALILMMAARTLLWAPTDFHHEFEDKKTVVCLNFKNGYKRISVNFMLLAAWLYSRRARI